MELAILGLGRMGANMARRLLRGGHRVVLWNRTTSVAQKLAEEERGELAPTPADAVAKLKPPRILWVMLPSGDTTGQMLQQLAGLAAKGDILIDGGNSRYTDSLRRAEELGGRGFHFLDVGTSGGVWGLSEGYCLMIGGEREVFQKVEPIFRSLAQAEGYAHVGPNGAGHFTKMVHNGIEYGMLQAFGEGFEILKASRFKLDLGQLAHLWNHGSVVRSWLLELAERAFGGDPELATVKGYVEDSGEGRWTVQEAMDRDVPAPVITLSLLARFVSRQPESFSAKTIAALRREFGGHSVKKPGE